MNYGQCDWYDIFCKLHERKIEKKAAYTDMLSDIPDDVLFTNKLIVGGILAIGLLAILR